MVERNFHSHRGEIDLVMLDADNLVFVEVRSRNNENFGSAAESVTRKKQLAGNPGGTTFSASKNRSGQNIPVVSMSSQ